MPLFITKCVFEPLHPRSSKLASSCTVPKEINQLKWRKSPVNKSMGVICERA